MYTNVATLMSNKRLYFVNISNC